MNSFNLFHRADVFARHQVNKPVPVQSLTKCRMQDNLEFLQWVKRYWDQHYPGGEYDALGRRKASGAPSAGAAPASRAPSAGSARRGVTPTTGAARPRVATAASGAATAALQQEISTQKEAIAGLEKERDFYFAKLRDIELLLQSAIEADPELEKEEDTLVKHIQGILYSTEVCSLGYSSKSFPTDVYIPLRMALRFPPKERRLWLTSSRLSKRK
jgi:RP/EB family microtubule-associated protein